MASSASPSYLAVSPNHKNLGTLRPRASQLLLDSDGGDDVPAALNARPRGSAMVRAASQPTRRRPAEAAAKASKPRERQRPKEGSGHGFTRACPRAQAVKKTGAGAAPKLLVMEARTPSSSSTARLSAARERHGNHHLELPVERSKAVAVPRGSRTGANLPCLGEWPAGSGTKRSSFAAFLAPVAEEALRANRLLKRQTTRRAVHQGAAVRNGYNKQDSSGGNTAAPLRQLGSCAGDGAEEDAKMPGGSSNLAAVVRLHVYDLFDSSVFGFGAFHGGIEIFGVEWSYGGADPDDEFPPRSGVYPVIPKSGGIGIFRETVILGHARAHKPADVWRLMGHLSHTWLSKEYKLLGHNCLDFCSELVAHLNVDALPTWVTRLAQGASIVFSPLIASLEFGVMAEPSDEFEERDGSSEASSPNFRLSSVTTTVLEFEADFQWAFKCMVQIAAASQGSGAPR
eukprot:TRINITY_DN92383_c0_g1_i1.p1 TRINITY_DN92383_c0_g1~~TRINITY_DN92383_c0_g1_i1.p1  ORF type:complete len:456 (+),score=94.85 TRINITY_DN92383_c0_g1_i1:101-1468(+)